MHYFSNKFSKTAKRWGSPSQAPFLTFDFDDLKLRDLAKLWCFKLILTKSNLKIQYDVNEVTSSLLCR